MPALLSFAIIASYLLVTGRRYPLGAWLGLLWLVGLWLLVYTSHEIRGHLASDELYFATEPPGGLFSNRYLWLQINRFVSLFFDQPEEIVEHMRILNLSFLVIVYLYTVSTIRTIPPLLLAIGMSYFASVAALNLRDILILLGTLMFLNARVALGSSIRDQVTVLKRAPFACVLLILLRPLQFVQLFLSGFRLLYFGGTVLLLITLLQTPLGSQYFYSFAYTFNNFETVVAERAEDKGITGRKPTIENITFWTARFVLAPSPLSITERLLSRDPNYAAGRLDLGVRLIHRFSLFTLYIIILYYMIRYRRTTTDVLKRNNHIIKFGIIFSLTYGLFNFGLSHERVKLNLLILVLVLVDQLRLELRTQRNARENNLSNSHELA